jgi:hypothetical protein
MRRFLVLLLALAVALPIAACGGGDDSSQQAAPITPTSANLLPRTILGLTVKRENVKSRVGGVKKAYVEQTGLYSLRKGKELQATLQISTFNDKADVRDRAFRLAIVNQIGSTQPRAFRMGNQTVYLTSSKRQSVAVFFHKRSLAVLSTLDTYDQGRSLLRALLELDL